MATEGRNIVISELNSKMINTIQFKYRKQMQDYYIHCIQKGDISIPTVSYFASKVDGYREELVRLYNGYFGLFDYVNEIPDEVKIAQAAVLDGFCFFYNLETSTLGGICSLNLMPIGGEDVDEKILKKAFTLNREGKIHSFRIDFDFKQYSDEVAECKVVAHRAVIDNEVVQLVPYLASYELIELLKVYMNQGHMIGVKQTLENGSLKIRVISENVQHLAHYCDSPYAVQGMTTEYYPTQAFFYAPVLGAPSTTAMKTRVNLFNLDGIVKVKDYGQCKQLGIQKCQDPVGELFMEQAIQVSLEQLKLSDPDQYTRTVMKLPDIGILNNVMDGNIGSSTISNYLHTATRGTISQALKVVPGAKAAYEVRRKLISGENSEAIRADVNASNLRDALRKCVLKVVWKKSNGMYTSAICTNNSDILRSIYGDDYFRKYESHGVRISNLIIDLEDMHSHISFSEVLKYYGFEEGILDKILENRSKGLNMEESVYNAIGKTKRASNSNPMVVTARTLAGYLSKDPSEGSTLPKSNDYYVSIDLNHLVRAEVIG